MRKYIGRILLLLGCLLMLAGCGCDHVWQDATCLAPETCTLCGETQGAAADHDMQEATCQNPSTCLLCGKTEGEALPHQWQTTGCSSTCDRCGEIDLATPGHHWVDATCQNPKFCEVCGSEEGDPLPHEWLEANCNNPKQCANCQTTEGTALGHTLEAGSDGVTGICTVCGKAVEYFRVDNTLYALTEYDVSGSRRTNPVTYVLVKPSSGKYDAVRWYSDGVQQLYEHTDIFCKVYCAEGKVYYFKTYIPENPEAVVKALANAASKYVNFVQATYSNLNCLNPTLDGPGGWLYDTRGFVNAAVDVYGNPYAIVHKTLGTLDNPVADDPSLTWAVSCNWMK